MRRNDWDFLYKPVIVEDIKDTLFHMGGLKAPRPDGLHALFFQSQWTVLSSSICDLIFKIFHDPEEIWSIN